MRGRQLGSRINAVYTEFNQCFTSFASKTYDVLDPDDNRFIMDFGHFQLRIREMDMKLLAILCQAFDDCNNLESIFKVRCQVHHQWAILNIFLTAVVVPVD